MSMVYIVGDIMVVSGSPRVDTSREGLDKAKERGLESRILTISMLVTVYIGVKAGAAT